jgi:nucleotide-binding universal stress UspA family protein
MKYAILASDFSQAAENALVHAATIAKKAHLDLVILHIKNNHTEKLLEAVGQESGDLEPYMKSICDAASNTYGIQCRPVVREGSIFNEISHEASDPDCVMLVMGTHGSRGLRQKLFGADLLKIAKKPTIPVLATPDNARLVNDGIQRILFPYGGREHFEQKLKAVAFLAGLYSAEVVFYTIDRPGMHMGEKTKASIEKAVVTLTEKGIRHQMVRDEMKSFSIGFANQTLAYAKENSIQMIAVISTPGDKLAFISEVDKEALINNEYGISILLTADTEVE